MNEVNFLRSPECQLSTQLGGTAVPGGPIYHTSPGGVLPDKFVEDNFFSVFFTG